MHTLANILQQTEQANGTYMKIFLPNVRLGDMLCRKGICKAEIRFDDGRHISIEQRKKAYATIRDIADYTGNLPEVQKEDLKMLHRARTGDGHFSLSDCSMDMARSFINTMMDYVIENGIPLSERGIYRTDDIGSYLYACIKNKKCSVCGKDGEIHHEDTIGMGNDRRTIDDSGYRKICLCREHHTIAHQMGVLRFREMYKIYGIVVNEYG